MEQNNMSKLLDIVSSYEQEKDAEKKLEEEQKRREEKEKKTREKAEKERQAEALKLKKLEEERQKTLEGYYYVEENENKLKKYLKVKADRGVNMKLANFFVNGKEYWIDEETLVIARIAKLFWEEMRVVILDYDKKQEEEINSFGDIYVFTSALYEVVQHLCSVYVKFLKKFGIDNISLDEITTFYQEMWINEEFLEPLTELYAELLEEFVEAGYNYKDKINSNGDVPFDIYSLLKNSILYRGSTTKAMIKADVLSLGETGIQGFLKGVSNAVVVNKLKKALNNAWGDAKGYIASRYIDIIEWAFELEKSMLEKLLEAKMLTDIGLDQSVINNLVLYYVKAFFRDQEDKSKQRQWENALIHILTVSPYNSLVYWGCAEILSEECFNELNLLTENLGTRELLLRARSIHLRNNQDEFLSALDYIDKMNLDEYKKAVDRCGTIQFYNELYYVRRLYEVYEERLLKQKDKLRAEVNRAIITDDIQRKNWRKHCEDDELQQGTQFSRETFREFFNVYMSGSKYHEEMINQFDYTISDAKMREWLDEINQNKQYVLWCGFHRGYRELLLTDHYLSFGKTHYAIEDIIEVTTLGKFDSLYTDYVLVKTKNGEHYHSVNYAEQTNKIMFGLNVVLGYVRNEIMDLEGMKRFCYCTTCETKIDFDFYMRKKRCSFCKEKKKDNILYNSHCSVSLPVNMQSIIKLYKDKYDATENRIIKNKEEESKQEWISYEWERGNQNYAIKEQISSKEEAKMFAEIVRCLITKSSGAKWRVNQYSDEIDNKIIRNVFDKETLNRQFILFENEEVLLTDSYLYFHDLRIATQNIIKISYYEHIDPPKDFYDYAGIILKIAEGSSTEEIFRPVLKENGILGLVDVINAAASVIHGHKFVEPPQLMCEKCMSPKVATSFLDNRTCTNCKNENHALIFKCCNDGELVKKYIMAYNEWKKENA